MKYQSNVDSNNGGNKVVVDNNDDEGVRSWDVDLVDDHVVDDDDNADGNVDKEILSA